MTSAGAEWKPDAEGAHRAGAYDNGPMLNAYPDSLGGDLSGAVGFYLLLHPPQPVPL